MGSFIVMKKCDSEAHWCVFNSLGQQWWPIAEGNTFYQLQMHRHVFVDIVGYVLIGMV